MDQDEFGTSVKPVEVLMQTLQQPSDIPKDERLQDGIVSHLCRVADPITGVHVCKFGRASAHLSGSLSWMSHY